MNKYILLLAPFLFSSVVQAGSDPKPFKTSLDYAQVQQVDAVQSKDGSWCFNTQVKHNDQGWEHYADEWQVADLEGNVLGSRKLLHPHDNEQPFTRSLCNIELSDEIRKVVVSAKCNLHDFSGQHVVVDLSTAGGKEFTVKTVN